jgi:hypothetical protein
LKSRETRKKKFSGISAPKILNAFGPGAAAARPAQGSPMTGARGCGGAGRDLDFRRDAPT